MYIIKNALRCISRSPGRSILIGIIVLVISVASCIGLSIRRAADTSADEALAGMSVTGTISVDRQSMMGRPGEGGEFDREQFEQMMGSTSALTVEQYLVYAEAASVSGFYYTVTLYLDAYDGTEPVSTTGSSGFPGGMGGFGGGMGGFGGMGMSSGDFTLVGYSSDAAMTSFIDGTASIVKGAVFAEGTESLDCIISEELAVYNSLSVGDTLTLCNPSSDTETYTLTVVGIYSDSSANESFQSGFGSDPANSIYLSSAALDAITEASALVSTTVTDSTTGREYETALTGNISATYVFADTDAYYRFEDEARALGLSDAYSVSSPDISAYESSLVPLETLGTMAGWFLLIILTIGAVILIVLNIFSIRERKYEIGVLLAVGMKKSKVAMQFLTEVFAVTMAAVIIGIVIGGAVSVPVTNALLENQAASSAMDGDRITDSFGRGEMPDIGSMGGMQGGFPGGMQGGEIPGDSGGFFVNTANYISKIDSAMDLTVVLQMLGIAVLLTLAAGTAAILFITRYEPLKILANRD